MAKKRTRTAALAQASERRRTADLRPRRRARDRLLQRGVSRLAGPVHRRVARPAVATTTPTPTRPARGRGRRAVPTAGGLLGRSGRGTVARSDAARPSRRHARFVRLGDGPDDLVALVVVVDEQDLPEGERCHRARRRGGADGRRPARSAAAVPPRGGLRATGSTGSWAKARRCVGSARRSSWPPQCHASVLVVGPPGSGRQHVAAAIHYGSDPEHEGSLIPLACSALGAELIQSTIRALAANPLGERAARSTLVLNEVGPAAAGSPRGIGRRALGPIVSSRDWSPRPSSRSDVLVDRGGYREDLAAVLGTIADRAAALGPAPRGPAAPGADVRRGGQRRRAGSRWAAFSPEALDRLDAYAWPGNVDELAQIVAQAHEHAEGPEIAVGRSAQADSPGGRRGGPSAAGRRADPAGRLSGRDRVRVDPSRRWPRPRATRPRPPGCWGSPGRGSIAGWCSSGWKSSCRLLAVRSFDRSVSNAPTLHGGWRGVRAFQPFDLPHLPPRLPRSAAEAYDGQRDERAGA